MANNNNMNNILYSYLNYLENSSDNISYLVSKIEKRVLDTEGIKAKEGYIYQLLLEEVAHIFVKGLLLDKA